MVRASAVAAVLALAILPSCASSRGMLPAEIDERGGRLFVDGLALDHHREVALDGELDEGSLVELVTHTGLIDVVGVPGTTYELVVDVYSEHEGDGRVRLENGQLFATGGRGRCVVNGIRGRLPESVHLKLQSATGDVVLTSFSGEVGVDVSAGTGAVTLMGCHVATAAIDAVTGSVRVADSRVAELNVDSGTSTFLAEKSDFGRFHGESGTGDFRFRDSRLQWARFLSATGDVVLRGTPVSEVLATLGTGQLLRHEDEPQPAAR